MGSKLKQKGQNLEHFVVCHWSNIVFLGRSCHISLLVFDGKICQWYDRCALHQAPRFMRTHQRKITSYFQWLHHIFNLYEFRHCVRKKQQPELSVRIPSFGVDCQLKLIRRRSWWSVRKNSLWDEMRSHIQPVFCSGLRRDVPEVLNHIAAQSFRTNLIDEQPDDSSSQICADTLSKQLCDAHLQVQSWMRSVSARGVRVDFGSSEQCVALFSCILRDLGRQKLHRRHAKDRSWGSISLVSEPLRQDQICKMHVFDLVHVVLALCPVQTPTIQTETCRRHTLWMLSYNRSDTRFYCWFHM